MVSRKQIHQKNANKTYLNTVTAYLKLAVLGFLVIIVFLVIPIKYSQAHFEAQEAVGQVYQSQEWDYLKSQTEEADIEAAQQRVDQIFSFYPSVKKVTYNRVLEQAHQKLVLEDQLNSLFVKTENNQDQNSHLILKEDLSQEELSIIKNGVEDLPHDSMRLEAERVLVEVENLLTRIERTQAGIEKLPAEIQVVEEINALSQQVVKFEEELSNLDNQAQIESLSRQLLEKTTLLSQELQEIVTEETAAAVDTELVFQSYLFSEQLDGTVADTRKLFSLTFDDGPNLEYTPEVLDILDKYQIKATFFLLGQQVENYPELAQEIVARGHLIGNHSYDHPDYETLTDEEILEDFTKTQDIIEEVTQIRPVIYRTPYGGGGGRVVRLLEGATSVIWNVDSEDWLSRNSQTIYEKVMDELQPKTLLLMHDSHEAVVPALEILIPVLKEEGYVFVDPLEIGYDFLFFE